MEKQELVKVLLEILFLKQINKTSSIQIESYIVNENATYKYTIIIDTPGTSDSYGNDNKNIKKMVETLEKKYVNGIKSILFLLIIQRKELMKKLINFYIYIVIFFLLRIYGNILDLYLQKFLKVCLKMNLKKIKNEKENEFKKGLIEQIEKCNKRVNKELRKNIILQMMSNYFLLIVEIKKINLIEQKLKLII